MRFYSTRGEHVNHYTTDAVAMLVNKNYTESLLIKRKEKKKKKKKKTFWNISKLWSGRDRMVVGFF